MTAVAWYWVVEGSFAAGRHPLSAPEYDGSRRVVAPSEVDVFVDLTETGVAGTPDEVLVDYAGMVSGTRVWYPIPDMGVPTPELCRTILDGIDGHLAADRTVYVHCHGGIGRTGTIVGCWLRRHGTTAADVLAEIGRLRSPDPRLPLTGSPETIEQRRFVQRWDG